jgi:hypothetical protein
MASMMLLATLEACRHSRVGCVGHTSVKELPSEERIKARLRELTEDSRKLREELEKLIRHEPNRTRSFAHDRPIRTAARRRKPRT